MRTRWVTRTTKHAVAPRKFPWQFQALDSLLLVLLEEVGKRYTEFQLQAGYSMLQNDAPYLVASDGRSLALPWKPSDIKNVISPTR